MSAPRAGQGFKKFARKMLATTCLTGLSAAGASAQVVNETTYGDFGNTFAARTNVGPALRITGAAYTSTQQNADFFQATGYTPSLPFTITGTYTQTAPGVLLSVFNSSSATLGSQSIQGSAGAVSITGTVPADGILVFGVVNNNESFNFNYDLTVTAAQVPEPASLALTAGAAAAGAVALRRRRRKDDASA